MPLEDVDDSGNSNKREPSMPAMTQFQVGAGAENIVLDSSMQDPLLKPRKQTKEL
jgi:hypothetical protein